MVCKIAFGFLAYITHKPIVCDKHFAFCNYFLYNWLCLQLAFSSRQFYVFLLPCLHDGLKYNVWCFQEIIVNINVKAPKLDYITIDILFLLSEPLEGLAFFDLQSKVKALVPMPKFPKKIQQSHKISTFLYQK